MALNRTHHTTSRSQPFSFKTLGYQVHDDYAKSLSISSRTPFRKTLCEATINLFQKNIFLKIILLITLEIDLPSEYPLLPKHVYGGGGRTQLMLVGGASQRN